MRGGREKKVELACTSGNPFRAPAQGFLWYPRGLGAGCPKFAALSVSLILFADCFLSVSPSPCVYMHQRPSLYSVWCPWAWMLTDAGWGCRAQLGLIAAVYLIKTWEDPIGASTREDALSIYRSKRTYPQTRTLSARSRGVQKRQENRCFSLSLHILFITLSTWLGACSCVCASVYM